MARLIVKNPKGLYNMWSTIIDSFIYYDLTKEEYIDVRAKEVYADTEEELQQIFIEIEKNSPKSKRYTKDYNECMEIIE